MRQYVKDFLKGPWRDLTSRAAGAILKHTPNLPPKSNLGIASMACLTARCVFRTAHGSRVFRGSLFALMQAVRPCVVLPGLRKDGPLELSVHGSSGGTQNFQKVLLVAGGEGPVEHEAAVPLAAMPASLTPHSTSPRFILIETAPCVAGMDVNLCRTDDDRRHDEFQGLAFLAVDASGNVFEHGRLALGRPGYRLPPRRRGRFFRI